MLDRITSNSVSHTSRTAPIEAMDTRQRTERNRAENEALLEPTPVNEKGDKLLNHDELDEIVKSLNEFLQPSVTSLKFELHDKLNEYYVTVVDRKTDEVVREIPAKKMLDFYAAMTEFVGFMIDKKI